MARTRLAPRNFASGELAPWTDGLPGTITASGARTLENFIVKKQGQITRRPGSFYVNEVKTSSNSHTILVPVTIDDTHTYQLEMGDSYIRFYTSHARITYPGTSTIYEVTTPWSTGDLTSLRWVYLPDEKALVFTNRSGNYLLRKLTYASSTSWTLSTQDIIATDRVIATHATGTTIQTEDLKTWTRGPSNMIAPGETTVGYLSAGRFNYIMDGSNANKLKYSPDGSVWVDALPSGVSSGNVAQVVANYLGEIVFTGTTTGTLYVSYDDGVTWTQATTIPAGKQYRRVAFDASVHGWRAAGQDQNAYSYDGASWVSIADIAGTQGDVYLDSDGSDHWVMIGTNVGVSGNIWYAQSISAPWTIAYAVPGGEYFSNHEIAFGKPGGVPKWVAITHQSSQILTSPDGQTWSNVSSLGFASGIGKALSWVHNKFILASALSTTGVDNYIYESYDGQSFSQVSGSVTRTRQNSGLWRKCAFFDAPDYEWFDQTDHFPLTLCAHEGRLILAGTNGSPSTLWGSAVNNHAKFFLGDTSQDAFSYSLTSDKNVDIQWVLGGLGGVVVGTRTAEGILIGSPDEGITPLTAQFRWLSTFGSDSVQPVRIHDTIVFVQRGGEVIRGFVPGKAGFGGSYIPDIQAYNSQISPDLTAFADHITSGGVVELDHQDDPQSIVYATRTDGQVLNLTFDSGLRAWSRTKMGATAGGTGVVESLSVGPTSGAEDEIWAVVKWTVGGSTKRYIVYFSTIGVSTKEAAHYVDCGYYNAAAGSATVYSAALPQLAGESVDVLINGNQVERGLTVAAGGTVTITTAGATSVHIGLPYVSYAQTLRPDPASPWGSGAGISRRQSTLLVWVSNSIGGEYGPVQSTTEPVSYTSSTGLTTDLLSVNFPGEWNRDSYIWAIQRDPLPLTVVAVAPDLELGDR